jgi:CHAT domain-containing protein
VRTFSILCADPNSRLDKLDAVGSQLYSIFVSPIVRGWPRELRVDAPPELSKLDFGALVGPDGSYFASHTAIVLLGESWAFRAHPKQSLILPATKMLLVDASTSSHSGVRSIPAAYDEKSEILRRFPNAELITDQRALASQIIRLLPLTEVFHFSGHAVSERGSSEMLLEDQPITAETIDALDLPHCRLAVLASCATFGTQTPQRVDSLDLPGAFLRAGAKDVLASRWDADSEATRILMISFYDELLKGNSPAFAFKEAQDELRSQSTFQHPYYWSAFSLLEQ